MISSPNTMATHPANNDSDEFPVEDGGGRWCFLCDMQNEELGFIFAVPGTRSYLITKTTRLCFGRNFSNYNGTQLLFKESFSLFFSVKREMPILFFVNCERTVLFSVKRDLDPPLYHPLFTSGFCVI